MDESTENNEKDENAQPDLPEEDSLEKQILELKEQHLRDHAEMENLRKRMGREMEKSRLFAIENFARDLLPVMDNMRRALAVLEKDAGMAAGEAAAASDISIKDGIRMTLRETEAVLARHDVVRIKAEGEVFDPNKHEALFEVMDSSLPSGAVAQIIEEGYMIGARLLRPARVGVAASSPAASPATAQKPAPGGENQENDKESPKNAKNSGDYLSE